MEGLKETKVTHMYASVENIGKELKNMFLDVIRNNRPKHTMHNNPDNLNVIARCTHCWWNPMNSKVLRQYIDYQNSMKGVAEKPKTAKRKASKQTMNTGKKPLTRSGRERGTFGVAKQSSLSIDTEQIVGVRAIEDTVPAEQGAACKPPYGRYRNGEGFQRMEAAQHQIRHAGMTKTEVSRATGISFEALTHAYKMKSQRRDFLAAFEVQHPHDLHDQFRSARDNRALPGEHTPYEPIHENKGVSTRDEVRKLGIPDSLMSIEGRGHSAHAKETPRSARSQGYCEQRRKIHAFCTEQNCDNKDCTNRIPRKSNLTKCLVKSWREGGGRELVLMKNEVLENGDIVGQYTGEVTGGKEEDQVGFYSLQMPLFKRLDDEIVQGFDNKRKLPKPVSIFYVDASKKGNLTRFMNHSCKPNCVYDT